ncbi:putative 4-hydroxy-tetrahydrodipicolinate synthase [Helianthus debilis subsp. tardiflorus]
MRSFEVKNRTSTDEIKSLRLITAIKTPYLPDGRFDLEAYDALVHMQIEDGVDGVIVGGTTGEGQLMSWDEHIMLIGHTINCFGTSIKVKTPYFFIFHFFTSLGNFDLFTFFYCFGTSF